MKSSPFHWALEWGPLSVRYSFFVDFLNLSLGTLVVMVLSRSQSPVSRILSASVG